MSEPITDAEVVSESQALVLRQNQELAPTGLFGTQEPVAIIEKATGVATALKAVITKQGLISRISGKEYPKCEAWTLLGTMLGVFPVLCWSKPVEGGWEARVEARTKNGAVVGAADAQCLRGERNWKDRDDFALRSMAQTRATAKCLRMPLGFVMTLAGYEPTPAEEMTPEPQQPRQAPPGRAAAPAPSQHTPKAPAASPAPAAAQPAAAGSRAKMISALKAGPGEPNRAICTDYFRKLNQLSDTQEIESLPLCCVPAMASHMKALADKIAGFGNGEPAAAAFPPHKNGTHEPAGPAPAAAAPARPVYQGGARVIVGVLEKVTTKDGTSSKGAWTLYGIKVGDDWYNTFSKRVGAIAQELVGKSVEVQYTEDDKGKTVVEITDAGGPAPAAPPPPAAAPTPSAAPAPAGDDDEIPF